MINVKELRIGNYVLFNEEYRIAGGVNRNTVDILAGSSCFATLTKRVEEIFPIDINREMLAECGFDDAQTPHLYKDNEGKLTIRHNTAAETYTISISFGNHQADEGIEIKYLHQLQNLYYYLVGKELETKLPGNSPC